MKNIKIAILLVFFLNHIRQKKIVKYSAIYFLQFLKFATFYLFPDNSVKKILSYMLGCICWKIVIVKENFVNVKKLQKMNGLTF